MASGIRFAVLGPVRAWRDGVEIDLGSPQQRAVLAILLLREDGQVSLDELIDGVWGDQPPRAAISIVRTYIYRLRRILGPGDTTIASVGGGYTLRVPADAVDLRVFRAALARAEAARRAGELELTAACLQEALDQWTGPPLMGVGGRFLDGQRAALAQHRLGVLEDRLAADVELGEYVRAVVGLSTLVNESPLRERPRELLMLALYRSGRQADALAVYQKTRELLATELGLDPGPGLQEIHRQILGADPRLAGEAASQASAPVVGMVPSQLPAAVPDFTGREEIIKELTLAASAPDGPRVIGITGLAGVGKTALATQFGHALRERFPDGQLFISLTDADGRPVETGEALQFLLQSIGTPAHLIPDGTCQRAAMWRSSIVGRRLLLVLDDIQDGEQANCLMLDTGSLVVVTAQRRLPEVAGARWFTLEGLAPGEALRFLRAIVGPALDRHDPQAVDDIAAACSYLPLPLRVLASRVAARPDWDLGRAGIGLSSRVPNIDLRMPDCAAAVRPLDRSYERLPQAVARAFRLLAGVEGIDLSVPLAASVLGLTEDEADRLLEILADLHLLRRGRPGRYRYPDLVRSYVRCRFGIADHEQGRKRGRGAVPQLVGAVSGRVAQPEAAPAGVW
ncbi:AfsR/SARP family transcriptional regulator [Phytohabitans flavus]|uniref:AfsR/SARP family transcriptional regulator n=1 Tax=Phytohabitans flavus TaxID=1076124 RepID=UPI00366FE4A8